MTIDRTAKALELLNAGIANMEAAGDYPLKTREPLERLAASLFWRGVGALCVRDDGTGEAVHQVRSPAHQAIAPGESEAG